MQARDSQLKIQSCSSFQSGNMSFCTWWRKIKFFWQAFHTCYFCSIIKMLFIFLYHTSFSPFFIAPLVHFCDWARTVFVDLFRFFLVNGIAEILAVFFIVQSHNFFGMVFYLFFKFLSEMCNADDSLYLQKNMKMTFREYFLKE